MTPLFVCHANASRSMLAAYLYQHLCGATALYAGVYVGALPAPTSVALLARWGIDASAHRPPPNRSLCDREDTTYTALAPGGEMCCGRSGISTLAGWKPAVASVNRGDFAHSEAPLSFRRRGSPRMPRCRPGGAPAPLGFASASRHSTTTTGSRGALRSLPAETFVNIVRTLSE